MIDLDERLRSFRDENNVMGKGPLSFVVQFTRMASEREFPLNPDDFKTEKEGQVAGLSGSKLKKILKEHGITQRLSSEGGRTSRGSMGLMFKYVEFLNGFHDKKSIDFAAAEEFWVEQVREYFRNQPFVLTADTSKQSAQIWTISLNRRKRDKQKIRARNILARCSNIL